MSPSKLDRLSGSLKPGVQNDRQREAIHKAQEQFTKTPDMETLDGNVESKQQIETLNVNISAAALFEQQQAAKKESAPKKVRVTVLIDEDLAKDIDALCKERGYGFKTIFAEQAFRNQLRIERE